MQTMQTTAKGNSKADNGKNKPLRLTKRIGQTTDENQMFGFYRQV